MSFVIFDLDGVLVDSEQVWDQSRKDVVAEHGGEWTDSATTDMLGMSSKEWPVYLIEELGVPLSVEEINEAVVDAMLREYREHLPLLPGAREAVARMADAFTLGLASSSNRPIIDVVLQEMGVTRALQGDGLLRGGRARQAGARTSTRRRCAGSGRTRRPRSRTPTPGSAPRTPPACT